MKNRLLIALAALLAAVSLAFAATSTSSVSLSTSAYTDLGAGPMWLGANGGAVIYQIADSQPSATADGNVAQSGQPPAYLAGSAHVWAKAGSGLTTVAVVTTGTGLTESVIASGASSGNIATGQFTNATGSATQIVAARTGAPGTGRISATLYNSGSVNCFVGASGVTSSTGVRIVPGGSDTIPTTAALYAVAASGTCALDYRELY